MSRVRVKVVWWSITGFGLLILAAAAGAYVIRDRSRHVELDAARQAMTEGRFAVAQQQLSRLGSTWSGGGGGTGLRPADFAFALCSARRSASFFVIDRAPAVVVGQQFN